MWSYGGNNFIVKIKQFLCKFFVMIYYDCLFFIDSIIIISVKYIILYGIMVYMIEDIFENKVITYINIKPLNSK